MRTGASVPPSACGAIAAYVIQGRNHGFGVHSVIVILAISGAGALLLTLVLLWRRHAKLLIRQRTGDFYGERSPSPPSGRIPRLERGTIKVPGVPGTARTSHFLAAHHLLDEDARIMTNSAHYRLPGVGSKDRAGATASTTVRVGPSPPSESAEADMCGCGHPHAQHDAVASRYCAATTAGSMTRGCVCAEHSTRPSQARQPG